MNDYLSILYILGLFFAFMAGSLLLRNQASFPESIPKESRFPRTTILLLVVIGIPSVLQFFFPALLTTFQRDYQRILNGDWWRIISPLFFQDGGLTGTIFNLVSLALIGSVAERIWNGKVLLIIFFVGGVIAEVVAFVWQPIGAGNSVGNFSLAASIAVAIIVRSSPKPAKLLAIIALVADGRLLGLQDIHGAAALIGVIQALFLNRIWHNDKKQD